MLEAVPVVIGGGVVDLEQGKIFRQEFHLLDEGAAEALGALDSAVRVELVAAFLAQRVAAENEQFGRVGGMVKLALTITAIHLILY